MGLYYDGDLVSIMTFGNSRFNKKYEYELIRFCCKTNTTIVGGASKLFKSFLRLYNPVSMISYSNIHNGDGGWYKHLGFSHSHISSPNYIWWYRHQIYLSRTQCQKHRLKEQGFEGDSEVGIMFSRGYKRIYDCGNNVWVYNKVP